MCYFLIVASLERLIKTLCFCWHTCWSAGQSSSHRPMTKTNLPMLSRLLYRVQVLSHHVGWDGFRLLVFFAVFSIQNLWPYFFWWSQKLDLKSGKRRESKWWGETTKYCRQVFSYSFFRNKLRNADYYSPLSQRYLWMKVEVTKGYLLSKLYT